MNDDMTDDMNYDCIEEAGEIARWQQVVAAADAVVAAANHYIAEKLPVPRDASPDSFDRWGAFMRVQDLLLQGMARMRFKSCAGAAPTDEQMEKVVVGIAEPYGLENLGRIKQAHEDAERAREDAEFARLRSESTLKSGQ